MKNEFDVMDMISLEDVVDKNQERAILVKMNNLLEGLWGYGMIHSHLEIKREKKGR